MLKNLSCRAAILLAVVLLSGCGDHGRTDQLVAAGAEAGKHLQSYYQRLTSVAMDQWEYQTALNTLRSSPATEATEREYADRLVSLRARQTLAARVADVYETLGTLRRSETTAAVESAGQSLGRSLTKLPRLSGVELSGGLGKAGAFLADRQRSRDVREANKAMTNILSGIAEQFAHEQQAYMDINRDRDRTRHALLRRLARDKMVDLGPLLSGLRLGVTWKNMPSDETTQTLALNVDGVKVERSAAAWACASEETATLLSLMAAGHEQLAKGGALDPNPFRRATARAAECLSTHQQVYP